MKHGRHDAPHRLQRRFRRVPLMKSINLCRLMMWDAHMGQRYPYRSPLIKRRRDQNANRDTMDDISLSNL